MRYAVSNKFETAKLMWKHQQKKLRHRLEGGKPAALEHYITNKMPPVYMKKPVANSDGQEGNPASPIILSVR